MKNQQRLTEICEKYYNEIRKFCLFISKKDAYAADSITSDTFYLLISKWDRLDFPSDLAILVWLKRTALFISHNEFRKQPDLPLEESLLNQLPAEEPTESWVLYNDYIFKIENDLSLDERLLFHRLVVDHISYRELSELMGISVNAIRLRWHRIREKIVKRFPNLFSNHNC